MALVYSNSIFEDNKIYHIHINIQQEMYQVNITWSTKEELFGRKWYCMFPTLLITVSTDADSRCPTNSNPLILDPPEIIGEYGTTVFVNCSSTIEDHDGIHWIYGNESYIEEDFNFITKSLLLSDWNVAQCKVKLNDSSDIECSKDLNITVYSKCFKSLL